MMRITQILFVVLFTAVVSAVVIINPVSQDPVVKKKQEIFISEQSGTAPTPPIAIPDRYNLRGGTYIGQTFNNCGPASLSMAFSFYNINVSQDVLAEKMRPFNNPEGGVDDKEVFVYELVQVAKSQGLESIERPNGTPDTIRKLVANDISVIVRTWLNPREDIGHYRVLTGYDKSNGNFYFFDSYHGQNTTLLEADLVDMWHAFNYGYILIYTAEKEGIVSQIVGEDMSEQRAWENALSRSELAKTQDPNNVYIVFNNAVAHYYLGDYSKSVAEYEKVAAFLPPRMLWYQPEPIYAYQKTGQYEKALILIDRILFSGNLAYSELYQVKGEVYQAQGDIVGARREFEKAVMYNENFLPAQEALQRL